MRKMKKWCYLAAAALLLLMTACNANRGLAGEWVLMKEEKTEQTEQTDSSQEESSGEDILKIDASGKVSWTEDGELYLQGHLVHKDGKNLLLVDQWGDEKGAEYIEHIELAYDKECDRLLVHRVPTEGGKQVLSFLGALGSAFAGEDGTESADDVSFLISAYERSK